jgi:hypothetical protein
MKTILPLAKKWWNSLTSSQRGIMYSPSYGLEWKYLDSYGKKRVIKHYQKHGKTNPSKWKEPDILKMARKVLK